jgi:hypothetical protein
VPALTSRPETSTRPRSGAAKARPKPRTNSTRQPAASAKRAPAKKSGGVSLTPALAAIQVEPQISDMIANSR